jgi:hypothetical protein
MTQTMKRKTAALLAGLLGSFLTAQTLADEQPTAVQDQTEASANDAAQTGAAAAGNDGSASGNASASKNVDPGIPPVGNVNVNTPRQNPNGGIFAPTNRDESTYDFLGVGGRGGSGGTGRLGTGVRMKW